MAQPGSDEQVIRYIMHRLGCTHPFYISRILFLAESRALQETGRRITGLSYRGVSYGFYIEELSGIIEKLENEGCAERHEKKGCIEYKCGEPQAPPAVKKLIDAVIEETRSLSPTELNRLAIHDENYGRLVTQDQG